MKTIDLTAVILLNPCVEESMQVNWWIFKDFSKYGYYNLTHCLDYLHGLQSQWLYIEGVCR